MVAGGLFCAHVTVENKGIAIPRGLKSGLETTKETWDPRELQGETHFAQEPPPSALPAKDFFAEFILRTARDVARRPIQGTPHMRHRLMCVSAWSGVDVLCKCDVRRCAVLVMLT